eukprot:6491994-Amphidinium_carterae.3
MTECPEVGMEAVAEARAGQRIAPGFTYEGMPKLGRKKKDERGRPFEMGRVSVRGFMHLGSDLKVHAPSSVISGVFLCEHNAILLRWWCGVPVKIQLCL